jgi:hypothetical protein
MSLIIKKNTTFKIPRTGSGGALLGLPASFTMVVTPSDVENLAGGWIKETGNFAYAWPFGFYYRTNTSRLFETSQYGMYGYINNNWEFRGWDEEYSELYVNTYPLAQASTNQTSIPTTQILLHGVGNRTMTNS